MGQYDDIVSYVFAKRYQLALRYTITELAGEFGINVSRLAGGLRREFDFDYTLFRQEALRWYVAFFRHLKKASELKRELNISDDLLTQIYREIGFRFGHGGDRRSEAFVERAINDDGRQLTETGE